MIYNGYGLFDSGEISPGDTVTLNYFNGTDNETIDVTVAAITSTDFLRSHMNAYGFLAPRALLEKMFPNVSLVRQLQVTTKNHRISRKTDAAIQKVVDSHELITAEMLSDSLRENRETNQMVNTLIFCGCIIVIGFSIINLLNTIISQLLSRNRELALLKAAGMTPGQIKKMLIYESIGLSLPSSVIGVILGSLAGWSIIFLLVRSGISYMTWHFPILAGILYILLSVLITVIISLMAYHYMEKASLTERLKHIE